jgi:flagellar hook-associated protein 3 FlgL
MRISTSTIYDQGTSSINDQTAALFKVQQQLASGKRILTAADDPIGAALALDLRQSDAANTQYGENITYARNALNLEDTVLNNVTQVLQDARVVAVNAGNPTLSAANLASFAKDLRGRYDQLLALANSKDGQGNYLFAGYKTSTTPFTQTTGAATYAGDQGQRKLQISDSRQIETGDTGQAVFSPGVAAQDPFTILDNFITQLNSGAVTSANINTALTGIDAALANTLRTRTSDGARLNEIDATVATNEDRGLQYATALSDIENVDYAKSISELNQKQVSLEAAQKSFLRVTGLNLFSLL